MTTEVKQIIETLVSAWNEHDALKVQRCYAPDCEEVDVALRQPQRGSAQIRKLMNYYFRAFPDVKVTLDEMICTENQAALLWTWQGTHRGRFMNIPPTHRNITIRGTTFATFEQGLVKRVVRIWDVAGLLRGLGLLPEL